MAGLLLAAGVALPSASCSSSVRESETATTMPHSQTATTLPYSGGQQVIDESQVILQKIAREPGYGTLRGELRTASGVLVFPRVERTDFCYGGKGSLGVLLARDPRGDWSPPAFYRLSNGTWGPHLDYNRTSFVVVLANEAALSSVLDGGLILAKDNNFAGSPLGETLPGRSQGILSDVQHRVADRPRFTGATLNGGVVNSEGRLDDEYYGTSASPRDIWARRVDRPGTRGLTQMVAALAGPGPTSVAAR